MKFISNITGTDNLIVNILVSTALTFIVVLLLVFIANIIINPSYITNASF